MEKVVIIGAGGHSKVILDILIKNKIEEALETDDFTNLYWDDIVKNNLKDLPSLLLLQLHHIPYFQL